MALLRACADSILVGAATMVGSPRGTWRPERAYPPASGAFAELRRRVGLSERPLPAFVTAGATLDPAHPALAEGALVLTTSDAAPGLRKLVPAAAEVVAVNAGARVDLRIALALLRERGHELILSEGGPRVFGGLLAAGLVDELFLTVSPLLAGRAAAVRLSLVEGFELLPGGSGATLLAARRHADHVFLRYALG